MNYAAKHRAQRQPRFSRASPTALGFVVQVSRRLGEEPPPYSQGRLKLPRSTCALHLHTVWWPGDRVTEETCLVVFFYEKHGETQYKASEKRNNLSGNSPPIRGAIVLLAPREREQRTRDGHGQHTSQRRAVRPVVTLSYGARGTVLTGGETVAEPQTPSSTPPNTFFHPTKCFCTELAEQIKME